MSELINLSLTDQILGLTDKSFSSKEITRAYLNEIKKKESLNCFISVFEEESEEKALMADENIAKNKARPLEGIPIAHKDIFCIKDKKTTCGSKMLSNFISPYSSEVFSKLDTAGAITLGKTNMDEFAMGSSNETSFYGNVLNPINEKLSPGGSSGGSAAAVRANLCSFATATDTGGSIRQPASFCGVTGIKPTYGRVSRWGMIAFCSSMDQAGPLARDAFACSALLNAMASYDEKDSTCSKRESIDYEKGLNKDFGKLKIGILKGIENLGISEEVLNAYESSMTRMNLKHRYHFFL